MPDYCGSGEAVANGLVDAGQEFENLKGSGD